jgi:hypothetical protein
VYLTLTCFVSQLHETGEFLNVNGMGGVSEDVESEGENSGEDSSSGETITVSHNKLMETYRSEWLG